jgi:hypothetical protein
MIYSLYLDYLSLPEEDKEKFLNLIQKQKGGKKLTRRKTRKLRRKN